MNFPEILDQLNSQLEEVSEQEQANQQEQADLAQSIEQLSQEIEHLQKVIEQKYHRQSELDREALDLCRRYEALEEKKEKISKIESFSAEFKGLQSEFQDNEDLLNTLYSSISAIAVPAASDFDSPSVFPEEENSQTNNNSQTESLTSDHPPDSEPATTILSIKQQLPSAERLYQKLVAKNLDKYHVYQNQILDGLDLIWCSVGFVAFGKNLYKQMCLKYHPDLSGSEQAMQLVNTAWEIAQEHVKASD